MAMTSGAATELETGAEVRVAVGASSEMRRGGEGRPGMMRAVMQDRYGTAEVLRVESVPVPAPGEGRVLVRVEAASLHIGDQHVMTGEPYLMRAMGFGVRGPRARVRGMDLAGVVVAMGGKVSGISVGDAVFGVGDGAFAEYAVARADKLVAMPSGVSFAQAAAVPTSACTALQSLRDVGRVQAGQRVLVIGASGGVGLFAVQIARALGAEVTGVCSGAKADLVRSAGAEHVIDYAIEDYARGGRRYDVILDMVGDRPLSRLRGRLRRGGTLVVAGGEGGGRWFGAVGRTLQAVVTSPFVKERVRTLISTPKQRDLEFLRSLLEESRLSPVIDRVYPLEEAQAAMRYLGSGQARGKLVIRG